MGEEGFNTLLTHLMTLHNARTPWTAGCVRDEGHQREISGHARADKVQRYKILAQAGTCYLRMVPRQTGVASLRFPKALGRYPLF